MRLRRLSMELSDLNQLTNKILSLEQYSTDGNLASRWIYDILEFGDLYENCRVCDLGSGNGVLGLGCLLMGASSAAFVEIDENACSKIKINAAKLGLSESIEIFNLDVRDFETKENKFDLVICNPPWGYQNHQADRPFLQAILNLNSRTHLMHSSKSKHFEKILNESNWSTQRYREVQFPLPASYEHHKTPKSTTNAGIWRLMPPILSNNPDR